MAYTGSAAQLDEFTVRVVDGMRYLTSPTQFPPHSYHLGPNNHYITSGQHADAFKSRVGKTHFAGFRVPEGNIWRAKGQLSYDISLL